MPCTAVSMRGPEATPGVDRVAQADIDEIRRADVAHGGEAGFERAPRVQRRVERLLGGEAHDACCRTPR